MIAARNIILPLEEKTYVSAFFVLIGFLPVLSIVFHCLGLLSMSSSLFLLIFPMATIMMALCASLPAYGRIALAGWIAGIIAVAVYDLSRIPYILYGWSDFIPKIGAWLSGTNEPHAAIGYAWRYFGNGGGMGMSFFILLRFFNLNSSFL